ncbi:uroporphyrinogen-III synthase [Sphingomonas alba]|uniref:Uroporphyrinogen-III synthase n=1 Tax=Sphingomonas alba TaxID=2908208 RepID=A0ABT0RMQ0_9SPHN|nr:uroporphyrinogen-III synthase [Sphingomonas alba]MCL6683805.1 uroporphyrinogen-III synthase [Sphingomonas alba]
MKPLVILRPEPGGSRSVARAQALGLEAIHIPLFAVVPIEWQAPHPGDFDAIILTSANTVRHGGEELLKLKSLPVHAVGEATAAIARAAGFIVVSVGEGGSRAMNLPQGQRLLHLTGRDHQTFPGATSIAVYEARTVDEPEGIAELKHCVVAVHSPRAGVRLAELVEDRNKISIAAISQAAADACGPGWQSVHIAAEPNDIALLALAASLCEGHDA